MYTACQKRLLPCPSQLETKLADVFMNSDPKCCAGEMITKLSGIIEEDSIYSNAVRHYIQRLRYKYVCYKFPLSICMIVKNEENNIERCLKSLEPIVSSGLGEIILVDTGSTDKTIELAQKHNIRLYRYPWQGSFSKARNFSISIAGGEYIFIVDADEEFKRDEINKLIEEFSGDGYKSYNSFSLKLINYTDIQLTQYALLTQPRIFKNNCRFYYSSAVHNQPVFDRPIKNLDVFVNHYGYIMTEDVKERKFKRTASLLMKELEANPRNIYYRFQLSTSYAMHGDSKEALYHVDLYMRELR
jgi:glycosyltransferase involved in cell wall biosynthesis